MNSFSSYVGDTGKLSGRLLAQNGGLARRKTEFHALCCRVFGHRLLVVEMRETPVRKNAFGPGSRCSDEEQRGTTHAPDLDCYIAEIIRALAHAAARIDHREAIEANTMRSTRTAPR